MRSFRLPVVVLVLVCLLIGILPKLLIDRESIRQPVITVYGQLIRVLFSRFGNSLSSLRPIKKVIIT